MPQPSQGAAALDAYLADIDRRLREIQAELGPESEPAIADHRRRTNDPPASEPVVSMHVPTVREPAPHMPEPAPPPHPPGRSGHGGRQGPLAELLQRDPVRNEPELDSLPVLHEQLLRTIGDMLDTYETVLAGLSSRAAPADVTVSAGPFSSIAAVRGFERELAELPGVSEVTLRGYEGTNRAIIDIRIA
jgi:hypothetical protein